MEKEKASFLENTPKHKKYAFATIGTLLIMAIFGAKRVIAIAAVSGAVWWVWKKSGFTKTGKYKALGGITLALVAIFALTAYAHRSPTLALNAPDDGTSVQAPNIAVSGNVSPTWASVTVNGVTVSHSGQHFSYNLPLNAEKTAVTVIATNDGKIASKSLIISRIYTEQEKADITAAKLKAEQERAAADAKAKAELDAYYATPSGRVCKKHPSWSKGDCEDVAKNLYWIGMSIDMLKAERGLPDNANPSNYGRGTSWQWCWDDYTPSCFYAEDDGIITSYN